MTHVAHSTKNEKNLEDSILFFFFEKQVLCSLINFKHIITLNSIVIENNNGIFNVYLIG